MLEKLKAIRQAVEKFPTEGLSDEQSLDISNIAFDLDELIHELERQD